MLSLAQISMYDPNDDPIRLSLSGSGSDPLTAAVGAFGNGSDLMAAISSSLHLLNGSDLAINGSWIWIIRLIRIATRSDPLTVLVGPLGSGNHL